MKKLLICYFSCTGNTKLACEYLQRKLTNYQVVLFDIRSESLPPMDDFDMVGFATYTDWCDAPLLMQEFLKKLPQESMKPAFVLNTCAGMSGKTLRTMARALTVKGYRVVAHFTLLAPESCPLLIALGKTKEEYPTSEQLQRFDQFINQLNGLELKDTKASDVKLSLKDLLTPSFPRRSAKLAMGRKYLDYGRCNQCGKCRQTCPYDAIHMEGWPVFNAGKCLGCWACFNNCPSKAIYTKRIKGRCHYQIHKDYVDKLK